MAHDPPVTLADIAARLVVRLAANGWQPLDSTGGPVDGDVAEAVACLGASEPVDAQGFGWDPDYWVQRIGDDPRLSGAAFLVPCFERAASMVESTDGGRLVVRRQHLFDMAGGDPVEFYVAVMGWGFGSTPYNWYRTALTAHLAGEGDLRAAVNELRSAARRDAPSAFDCWSVGGRGKLPRVGAAFGSKLAYFAGNARAGQAGPLIADANTGWAIWATVGIRNSAARRDPYLRYVDEAFRWAAEMDVRPDEVERAFFELGKFVSGAYWKAHPRPRRNRSRRR